VNWRLVLALTALGPVRAARAEPRACVVRGTSVTVERVTVRPSTGGAFTVAIEDAPVVATVPATGPTRLEVGGVIAFEGTVSKVWYSLTDDVVTADGLVTLLRGAHVVGGRAKDGTLRGDAVLYASDVMQGEAKDPDEAVSAVEVGCDHLTLDWTGDVGDPTLGGDGSSWHTRGSRTAITLRAQPSARAASVAVRSNVCGGTECLHLTELDRRGAWRKVGMANEGVMVTGWVRAAELAKDPEGRGLGYGYGCTGDHASDEMFGFTGGPSPVTARIRPGTQIYALPGKGAWASVTRDAEFRVRMAGADWATVDSLPGISGHPPAFVPRAALILTP
jgi:hypothetical protein